jgi:hypothetical protein
MAHALVEGDLPAGDSAALVLPNMASDERIRGPLSEYPCNRTALVFTHRK